METTINRKKLRLLCLAFTRALDLTGFRMSLLPVLIVALLTSFSVELEFCLAESGALSPKSGLAKGDAQRFSGLEPDNLGETKDFGSRARLASSGAPLVFSRTAESQAWLPMFEVFNSPRTLSIDGFNYYDPSGVPKMLEPLLNKSIFRVSSKSIREWLTQSPLIDDAQVDISWFRSSVEIHLDEIVPWHMIDIAGRGQLVTTARKILPNQYFSGNSKLQIDSSTLPRVTCPARDCGVFERAQLEGVWDLLDYLSTQDGLVSVDRLELRSDRTIAARLVEDVFLSKGGSSGMRTSSRFQDVLFSLSSQSDWENKFRQYLHVRRDLENRGEKYPVIDLRFKGQVVGRP